MARAARKTKSSSVKVNFKDVESKTRINKEGDYPLRVLEANADKSSNGNDQIEFVFEVSKGDFKGAKAWFYCPLTENSLWKLHALLTAMGVEVPEEEMDIDLSEMIDLEVVGVFTPDTYNGKRSFKMTDFSSIDDYNGDDDEDEKPKGKGKKAKASDDDDEDEKPKAKGKKAKPADDDDDEDEKPKAKAKGKKSKPKTYDKDEVEDMDEEELQEVIDASGIDVDLDDYKKLSKKVKAVIDALEEEELLDD